MQNSPAGSPIESSSRHRGDTRRAISKERIPDRRAEQVKDYPSRPLSRHAQQSADTGRAPVDSHRDRERDRERDRPRDSAYDRPASGAYRDDDRRDYRQRDDSSRRADGSRREERGRDRLDRPDGSSRRPGTAPPPAGGDRRPAPRAASPHSRGRTPPPPPKDRGGPADERTTPSSAGGQRSRAAGTPLGGSALFQELVREGKLKLAAREEKDGSGGDDDAEAGEILPEEAGRKRKHSPIVWDPSGAKQARADEPTSILERAQQEAMALKQMHADMDYDPDAPVHMKASPSVSSDDEDEVVRRGASSGAEQLHGNGDTANGEGHLETARGMRSRWLMQHEEEEGAAGPQSNGTAAGSPAAADEGAADREGAGLGVSDSSSDDEVPTATAPPTGPVRRIYDMRKECRDVHDFERVEKISEGMYGVVYKAREKATGRIVALKRVKMEQEVNGFPITSVREINILLNFHHPNIVNVEEVVISPRHLDQIYMVMEYMDHDLKSLMDDKKRFSQPFSAGQVKCLMQQLLSGVAFLHHNWVLHRDLKTSNILYNGKGDLKLCDFGMARQFGEPLGKYTHNVVTLWYRAPELLFGCEQYSTALDIWSVGCIMGEILTGKPLIPGQGEFDQIDKMVQLLGTPDEEVWPDIKSLPNFNKIQLKKVPSTLRQRFTASTGFVSGGTNLTEAGYDLLSRLLAWDPKQRITADEALRHRWFDEAPKPVARVLMPTFAPRKAG